MSKRFIGMEGEFDGTTISKKSITVNLTVSGTNVSDSGATDYLENLVTQFPDLLISPPRLSGNKISFEVASVTKDKLDATDVNMKVKQFVQMFEPPFKVNEVEAMDAEE